MIRDRYNILASAIGGINHIRRVAAAQLFDQGGAEITGPIRMDAAASVIEEVTRSTPALRRALRLANVDPDTGAEAPGSEGLLHSLMAECYDGIPDNLLELFLSGRIHSERVVLSFNTQMVAARTGGEIDPATGRRTPEICDGEPVVEFRRHLRALHDACVPLRLDDAG